MIFEELIIQAKSGNKEAFTELILHISNDLYKIGKTRLYEDSDINDAIQETMIKAYKNLKKLKEISNFKSWIIKILINECNKIYIKKYKKEKLIEKIKTAENINRIDNSTTSIDSKINFELLIDKLNHEEKLIVILYYNNKYSCSEIAEILNMNINTVKSRLKRAKEKVKKYYNGGVFYE